VLIGSPDASRGLSIVACMNQQMALRLMISTGLLTTFVLSSGPPVAAQLEESVATGPDCQIQLSLGSPAAGATEVPASVVMSGSAFDVTAQDGTGISQVQAFLGPRDEGGQLLGDATFDDTVPGSWTLLANFPTTATGPGSLFIYGQSASSGMEARLEVPITVVDAAPPIGSPSAFCPATLMEPVAQLGITNVEWQWTAADDPSAYTITFLDDGRFQVRADCNLSSGGYVIEGTTINLSSGPTTLAACPPGSLFDQFLGDLSRVTSYTLDANGLVLSLDETGKEMVFAPSDSMDAFTLR
jgi:heat shock protein HslJ